MPHNLKTLKHLLELNVKDFEITQSRVRRGHEAQAGRRTPGDPPPQNGHAVRRAEPAHAAAAADHEAACTRLPSG